MFDFPDTPTIGQAVSGPNNTVYRWDGTKWAGVAGAGANAIVGATPPTTPLVGMLWFDTTGGLLYMWYDDGNSQQWINVNNFNAPSPAPVTGPLYYTATGGSVARAAQDRAADSINVLDYGAKADAQTTTTSVSVTGNAVTVGANLFVSSDVGKIIGAMGATGPGIIPASPWVNFVTITAYTSPTQVTVNASIGTPFSNSACYVAWGTNNSSAFQAAANQINAIGGGRLYVPSGRYAVGNMILLYSETEMWGNGASSEIINCGIVGSQGSTTIGAVISNYNAFIWPGGQFKKLSATYYVQTTPANQIDHDIIVRDLQINAGAQNTGGSAKTICFALATQVKILNCKFQGQIIGMNPTALIGCDDFEIRGNVSTNCVIGHDHWDTLTRGRIISNTVRMLPNGGASMNPINMNAVPTTQASPVTYCGTTSDIVIADNVFELYGTNTGTCVSNFDSLGYGSVSRRIAFVNNHYIGVSGTGNGGIVHRGNTFGSIFSGNTFTNVNGTVLTISLVGSSAVALTNPITTTAGSTTATLAYPSHGMVADVSINGAWIHVPNMTIDGVTFTGIPYNSNEVRVLSVVDANTLTIQLPSAAVAGATGGTGNYSRSQGFATGMVVEGNRFINPQSAGSLIIVAGQNNYIGSNVVYYTVPGTTPTYQSIVDCEYYGGTYQMAALRQVGPLGSGPPAGYAGDGNIMWSLNGGSNQPTIGSAVTQAIGDENTTNTATTAFAARMLGSTTPTAANGTVYTSASTGVSFVNFIGSLAADASGQIPAGGYQKTWWIRNGTTGGHNWGVVGQAGTTYWIPPAYVAQVWSDGADIILTTALFGGIRVGDATRNAVTLTAGAATSSVATVSASGTGGLQFTSNLGFNSATPIAKPTISGACAGNTAIKNLLTALASYGLLTDSTTA